MRRTKTPQMIDLAEVLARPIHVSVNGTPTVMQPFEAEIEHCLASALAGNLAACAKFISMCRREGLLAKTPPLDEHRYLMIIPEDWDTDEFVATYYQKGPPPWSGKRDGLTPDAR